MTIVVGVESPLLLLSGFWQCVVWAWASGRRRGAGCVVYDSQSLSGVLYTRMWKWQCAARSGCGVVVCSPSLFAVVDWCGHSPCALMPCSVAVYLRKSMSVYLIG